jgi:hypothetical protein
MRKLTVNVVTALMIIAGTISFVPKASALPRDSIIINYYDCSFNLVGWQYRDCGAVWYQSGNIGAGSYRETIQTACSTGEQEYYAFDEWSLANQQWQPYDGDASDYCVCQAQGAC